MAGLYFLLEFVRTFLGRSVGRAVSKSWGKGANSGDQARMAWDGMGHPAGIQMGHRSCPFSADCGQLLVLRRADHNRMSRNSHDGSGWDQIHEDTSSIPGLAQWVKYLELL